MSLRDRLRELLRIRLFTKILVANAVLVSLAALAGALAGAELAEGSERQAFAVAVPVVLAGLVLTILVDAVILQLALDPLHQLERVAQRVRGGDLSARAPESAFADPSVGHTPHRSAWRARSGDLRPTCTRSRQSVTNC